MEWINEERYPDPTAGEAMDRVMRRGREDLDETDDGGIRLLAEAVVVAAAKDYVQLLRGASRSAALRQEIRELEAFFTSSWFRRISGLDGKAVLRRIRKEAVRCDRP